MNTQGGEAAALAIWHGVRGSRGTREGCMRLHCGIMSSSGHRMTSPFLKGHLEVFPADAMTSKRPFSGRRQAGGGRRRQARLSCQRRGRGGCTARLAAWHGLRGIGHRLEPPAASRHHYGVVGQAGPSAYTTDSL